TGPREAANRTGTAAVERYSRWLGSAAAPSPVPRSSEYSFSRASSRSSLVWPPIHPRYRSHRNAPTTSTTAPMSIQNMRRRPSEGTPRCSARTTGSSTFRRESTRFSRNLMSGYDREVLRLMTSLVPGPCQDGPAAEDYLYL